jgi:hypothetical protein
MSTALLSLALLGFLSPAQAQEKAPATPAIINYQPATVIYYPVNYTYYPYYVTRYPSAFVTPDGGYVTVGSLPGNVKDPRQYGSTAMVYDPASSSYYVLDPLNRRFYGPYHVNLP